MDTAPQYTFELQQECIFVICALHNFILILPNGKEDSFILEADQDSTLYSLQDDIEDRGLLPSLTSNSGWLGGWRLDQTQAVPY